MRRRQVLAALAGVGLTGGSLWVAGNGLPGQDPAAGEGLPIRIETIDAPGSTAGQTLVPAPNTVTVVDLFATWCAPCKAQMQELNAVRGEYENVAFVSVTNENVGESLTRAEVADWWTRHDGSWTVGLDPGSELLAAFGAGGIPYTAITDEAGRQVAGHRGLTGAATIREDLDEVL